MIGSHNSATYLKEKSWWMTILRPWTRCQTKTLREQYNSGIRYFDFRIKVFGDTEFGHRTNICHNNVLYKESLFESLCEIDYDDVYIRLILDYRKEPEDAERLSELFKSIINFIHDHYDLKIDNAITFWNWKEYIPSSFNIQEEHYSVDASHWYEWILGPFLFNKLKEKTYKKHFKELQNKEMKHIVLLKDFI